MTDDETGFINRWSKRKTEARREDVETDASTDVKEGAGDISADNDVKHADANESATRTSELNDGASPAANEEMLDESDFDDVDFEALDKESDYTRFIKANVPASIQKRALRKLWASDKVFEVLDGMNDYDEDFTGNGLAGKIFKTAHKIGRGFVTDDDDDDDENLDASATGTDENKQESDAPSKLVAQESEDLSAAPDSDEAETEGTEEIEAEEIKIS